MNQRLRNLTIIIVNHKKLNSLLPLKRQPEKVQDKEEDLVSGAPIVTGGGSPITKTSLYQIISARK
jgi:hypothetical protein